jgi:hypothetical protein
MIELIVTVAIVGLIVWAIYALVPMPEPFKKIILVIAVVCVALYVLQAFGLWHHSTVGVPQLR